MIDLFLQMEVEKHAAQERQQKLAEQMRGLPAEALRKLASGDLMKVAEDRGENWLERFSGTPLLQSAIALENEEIALEMEKNQHDMQQPPPMADYWQRIEQIRLKKKMLDLQRVQQEAGGEAATPEAAAAGQAATTQPAADQPEMGAAGAGKMASAAWQRQLDSGKISPGAFSETLMQRARQKRPNMDAGSSSALERDVRRTATEPHGQFPMYPPHQLVRDASLSGRMDSVDRAVARNANVANKVASIDDFADQMGRELARSDFSKTAERLQLEKAAAAAGRILVKMARGDTMMSGMMAGAGRAAPPVQVVGGRAPVRNTQVSGAGPNSAVTVRPGQQDMEAQRWNAAASRIRSVAAGGGYGVPPGQGTQVDNALRSGAPTNQLQRAMQESAPVASGPATTVPASNQYSPQMQQDFHGWNARLRSFGVPSIQPNPGEGPNTMMGRFGRAVGAVDRAAPSSGQVGTEMMLPSRPRDGRTIAEGPSAHALHFAPMTERAPQTEAMPAPPSVLPPSNSSPAGAAMGWRSGGFQQAPAAGSRPVARTIHDPNLQASAPTDVMVRAGHGAGPQPLWQKFAMLGMATKAIGGASGAMSGLTNLLKNPKVQQAALGGAINAFQAPKGERGKAFLTGAATTAVGNMGQGAQQPAATPAAPTVPSPNQIATTPPVKVALDMNMVREFAKNHPHAAAGAVGAVVGGVGKALGERRRDPITGQEEGTLEAIGKGMAAGGMAGLGASAAAKALAHEKPLDVLSDDAAHGWSSVKKLLESTEKPANAPAS